MTATQAQPVPGEYFRWPGLSAPERVVPEPGPCAPATAFTLRQGVSTKAAFSHFENLDIVKGYQLKIDWSTTFTAGTSETITQSPLFPLNLIGDISLSMQAAYKTMNLPGWLAQVMQQYRSFQAPKSFTTANQNGSGLVPANAEGSQLYVGNPMGTPNLALTTAGAAQSYTTLIEIPLAMYFDLYWELNAADGQPIGAIPRAIVSPARMAATQRNVTPSVTFSPLLSASDVYDSPASISSSDTTSTASGTATCSWWRSGWVPTDNPLTEPVGYAWQYARMGLSVQPAGASAPVVNLADDRAGQGQILSLVFGTWDPALNSGIGGFTPPSDYEKLELRKGSTVQLFNDDPQLNYQRWGLQHGAALPLNLFGWDLALTDDGRLTNENALNTLVEAGVQIVPTYSTKPSNSATLYVGVESLQSVTN